MSKETELNTFDFYESVQPKREITLKQKLAWSFTFICLYGLLLNIPLIGVPHEGNGSDPFGVFRVITASQRGSLADIGIFPIVFATIFVQIMIRIKVLKLNLTRKKDREDYKITILFFSMVFSAFTILIYISSGVYGKDLENSAMSLIVLQLMFAQLVIIFMVGAIQRGYGLGTGIEEFILLSFSFNIFDGMFSL